MTEIVTYSIGVDLGQHVAAVKAGDKLTLYLNGKAATVSTSFNPAEFDLTTRQPLRIGFGRHDYFNGSLSDVRLYGKGLSTADVAELARKP